MAVVCTVRRWSNASWVWPSTHLNVNKLTNLLNKLTDQLEWPITSDKYDIIERNSIRLHTDDVIIGHSVDVGRLQFDVGR